MPRQNPYKAQSYIALILFGVLLLLLLIQEMLGVHILLH